MLRGDRIVGTSAVGRTTAFFLRFNDEERLTERRSLMVRGLYDPPSDAASRRVDDGSDDDRTR